jgi:TetR/AcrR family transcriptional repressor of nem operon
LTERSYLCLVKLPFKMSKGEITKKLIIEKAAPIFNVKGIEATAMSDIMEATKLSKGTLYVHFDNKEDLAIEALDYNIEKLNKLIMAEVNKAVSSKQKLFAYIDALANAKDAPIEGGCPLMNFGNEADDTNPIIKQKVHRKIEQTQQFLADIIQEGKENGEFRNDWDGDEFATLMFAMIQGGILMKRVAGNDNRFAIITNNIKKIINQNSL